MITLLIGDTDLNYAKEIISNIIKKNERLRLIDIVTSDKEAINAIKRYKPHFFILNADIFNIERIQKIEHAPKCICFTENEDLSLIKKYLMKNCNMKILEKRVNKLISENEFYQTKERIVHDFAKLKFNFSRVGTTYLMESIMYSYQHRQDYYHNNLERYVYTAVAEKYNTTPIKVKWLIIKSINEMYDKNYFEDSLKTVTDYFYYTNQVKPTAKVIIATFITKLDN